MKSCQDGGTVEMTTNEIDDAIMEWTAVFVRLWMHDVNNYTGPPVCLSVR
jgi:hypothetical protein